MVNANPKCPLCGVRAVYIGISGSAQPACVADCHLRPTPVKTAEPKAKCCGVCSCIQQSDRWMITSSKLLMWCQWCFGYTESRAG